MNLEERVNAIADRIKADVESLEPNVKAYKWGVGGAGMDAIPAAIVQIPKISRTSVDRPEDHLGELNVPMEFEVFFFFDASDITYFMPQAISIVTGFIDAIDLDPDLGGNALDAKVVDAEPANVEESGGRPLFAYACTVEVLAFI